MNKVLEELIYLFTKWKIINISVGGGISVLVENALNGHSDDIKKKLQKDLK